MNLHELRSEMLDLSNLMKTQEERLDAMTSCIEITVDDLERMNEYMGKHSDLVNRFRQKTTERDRKNSEIYGQVLARQLCLAKAFKDLMSDRCNPEGFAKIKEMAKTNEELKPIGTDDCGEYYFEHESDEEVMAWIDAHDPEAKRFMKMGHDFGDKTVPGRGIMKEDVTWRVYEIETYLAYSKRCTKVRLWQSLYPDTPFPHEIDMDNMKFWRMCKKKPIVVQVRDVRPDESEVETLEGFKPCDPKMHYIMKGVKGEEYPITKEIFDETYELILFTFDDNWSD